jgi:hypothetical protein
MQRQLDFSTPKVPLSGKNCPETSYEVAHKIRFSAKAIRARVYKFIKNRGVIGATAGEIDKHFRLGRNTTSPRITELKDDLWIIKTDLRRKNDAGHKETVWRVKI